MSRQRSPPSNTVLQRSALHCRLLLQRGDTQGAELMGLGRKGVEMVGLPRRGVLLNLSTWRSILGGSTSNFPNHQESTAPQVPFPDAQFYVPRQKKPPEARNALREKRVAIRQKIARYHAEVALCKYNRANDSKFELVDVRATRLFFEFGGGCIHYNFTAKQPDEGHLSADGGGTKLFFSEVNANLRDENDVLFCCTVAENDAGHCYGCEGHQPTVVHPNSQAYGGGSSTCINFPGSDGSSDSD